MPSLLFHQLCSALAQWAGRGLSDNRSSLRELVYLLFPLPGIRGCTVACCSFTSTSAETSPPQRGLSSPPAPTLTVHFLSSTCLSSLRHEPLPDTFLFMNLFLIDYPLPLWEWKLHDDWTCLSGSPVSPGPRLGPGTWLVFVGCFLNE